MNPNIVPSASPIDTQPVFNVDGVRSRRIFAFFIDLVMIFSLISAVFVMAVVFAIPTFGFSFFALFLALPALMPVIALLYNGVTVSGPKRATLGMRLLDIQITKRDGRTADFLQAAAHAALFYLPGIVFFAPHAFLVLLLLLPTFFEADKRMLHDLLLGLVVSRSEVVNLPGRSNM